MSDDNPFLGENETGGQDNSGSALRKFAEDQKRRADDLEKQFKDLQKQLASRTASDVFAKLGINDKVQKFYQGDPTEEAIAAWWKENASIFGVDPGVGQDPTLDTAQQEHQAAIDAVQQAASVGQDRGGAMSRETMQSARTDLLSKGRTPADLDAALARMNIPNTPFQAPQF